MGNYFINRIKKAGDGSLFLSDDGTYKDVPQHDHENKELIDTITDEGNGALFLANDGTYKGVVEGGASWGTITGTLALQTDLKSVIDAKAAVEHDHDTEYATLGHEHEIEEVSGLETALSGKATSDHDHDADYAALDHEHEIEEVSGLGTALSGKAASSHNHILNDITDLITTLAGKASTTHAHAQSDITGLIDALAGKAATSHTHLMSAITGLVDALAGKSATNHVHRLNIARTSSETYVVSLLNSVVLIDTTNNNCEIQLPTAVGNDGLEYKIKKTDETENVVTINPAGVELVDGESTLVLTVGDESVIIISDGVGWTAF